MKILSILLCAAAATSNQVSLQRDDESGKLVVAIDGREALTYQYANENAIPHYWPLRSPSGKLLTAQQQSQHPHHQSLWIADKVQGEASPAIDFYHCWKNHRVTGEPESGFRHFIRHHSFGEVKAAKNTAVIEANLRWISQEAEPLLDDHRTIHFLALGSGEYLIDLQWELTASAGDVKFLSDDVHYAWPYVCMHPRFSGLEGGLLKNDQGQTGQAGTHGEVAKWVDYSNTVDGEIEGLAVFIFPDGQQRNWLTREYGTFGPRRPDKLNGTKFTLKSGNQLKGRVGILVHRGDADSGRVEERYRAYIEDHR